MFQMAENNKGTLSKEFDVDVSESDNTEIPESVPLKPFYMEHRKKLEYWKVDLRID